MNILNDTLLSVMHYRGPDERCKNCKHFGQGSKISRTATDMLAKHDDCCKLNPAASIVVHEGGVCKFFDRHEPATVAASPRSGINALL